MDSQLFYFLNALFAVAFLLWFLAGKKGSPKPTSLNLRGGESQKTPRSIVVNEKQPLAPDPNQVQKKPFAHDYPVKYTPRERDVTGTGPTYGPKDLQTNTQRPASQVKKAQFVYNSHDWNAYEIFGLKPGATLPEVTKRYQEMIKKSDPGSLEFLETAYKTILRQS